MGILDRQIPQGSCDFLLTIVSLAVAVARAISVRRQLSSLIPGIPAAFWDLERMLVIFQQPFDNEA